LDKTINFFLNFLTLDYSVCRVNDFAQWSLILARAGFRQVALCGGLANRLSFQRRLLRVGLRILLPLRFTLRMASFKSSS
jgi:hypothetical protein